MKNITIFLILFINAGCNYTTEESKHFFNSITRSGINQKSFTNSGKFLLFLSNYCSSCGENIIKKTSEQALNEEWCIVVTGFTKAEVDYAATKFSTKLKIIKDYDGLIAISIKAYRDKPLLIETRRQNIINYKEY